jgi:hypothetical protein
MFGYHVHEKAALTVLLPMVLPAVRGADWGQQFVVLSTAAHVGIFPLLFGVQEVPVRWLLAVLYYIGCIWGLSTVHGGASQKQQQGLAADHSAANIRQPETPGKQQQQQQTGSADNSLRTPAGVRTRRQAAAASEQATPSTQRQLKSGNKLQAAAGGAAGGALQTMKDCCSWLPVWYRLYLAGFVVLELYCTLGHRFLLGERLPFVPLMLTSVYCALGVTWVWGWMTWWFVQRCTSSSIPT